jgi:hypothetical protein
MSAPRLKLTRPIPLAGAAPSPLQGAGKPLEIWRADTRMGWRHRWDHIQARWGYRRGAHHVAPGLYAIGQPGVDAPVLVTANYTLSFDAVRCALAGRDAYVLVLDTQGINVWCAAGKGAFGTDELAHRIEQTGLARVVRGRRLILPQLGAPGVAAHEVRRRTGFRVEYGPVRASDLPRYLDTGQATPQMRRVRFTLWDRIVLIPVEFVHLVLPMLGAAVVLYLLAGWWGALASPVAGIAGSVLFPLLLPWLPAREFSVKGFMLGALAALPVTLGAWGDSRPLAWASGLGLGLLIVATTAYVALNFTGATPITSRTGVAREMRRYIRPMAALAALGVLLVLASAIVGWIGG